VSRTVLVYPGLAAAILALLVLSIGTGEFSIPPDEVVRTLLGEGSRSTTFVIETLRLPRALTALLVGGSLGVAGALFQSISRNPLGSPDFIGFTYGAAAGAVLQILVFDGGPMAVAGGALVGGLLTGIAMYLLAFKRGVQGHRLVLVGVGLSAMLIALIEYLLTRARVDDALAAAVWVTGSLNGRGWEHVRPLAAAVAVLLPLLVLLSGHLRMIEMGDEAATALGVPVERSRLALILIGVATAAVATAAAGPIVFVALAAPQLARRLTRAVGPGLVAAGLMGAALLLASDLAVQRLFPSSQLPVGVATGVIGGVYLMWLLAREWRA
jgi:iron-siderophore transport system permease protein